MSFGVTAMTHTVLQSARKRLGVELVLYRLNSDFWGVIIAAGPADFERLFLKYFIDCMRDATSNIRLVTVSYLASDAPPPPAFPVSVMSASSSSGVFTAELSAAVTTNAQSAPGTCPTIVAEQYWPGGGQSSRSLALREMQLRLNINLMWASEQYSRRFVVVCFFMCLQTGCFTAMMSGTRWPWWQHTMPTRKHKHGPR